MADPAFSALDTVRYYERLARDNGGMASTLGFARYFLVPGMNHLFRWTGRHFGEL